MTKSSRNFGPTLIMFKSDGIKDVLRKGQRMHFRRQQAGVNEKMLFPLL